VLLERSTHGVCQKAFYKKVASDDANVDQIVKECCTCVWGWLLATLVLNAIANRPSLVH